MSFQCRSSSASVLYADVEGTSTWTRTTSVQRRSFDTGVQRKRTDPPGQLLQIFASVITSWQSCTSLSSSTFCRDLRALLASSKIGRQAEGARPVGFAPGSGVLAKSSPSLPFGGSPIFGSHRIRSLLQNFARAITGGVTTDALVCHVFQKLQLPQDSIQQLHTLLDEGTALEQAGLSSTARNCFSAIHRNTHLWLPGQNDVVATSLETRPGDSFADVILGFIWGLVLKKSEVYLKDSSLIACFEAPERHPFFQPQKDDVVPLKPFLGPTWMDDLCLCLQHCTASGLEHAVGPAVGYFVYMCDMHLMSPNLNKGKTELLLCFQSR